VQDIIITAQGNNLVSK